MQFLDNYRGNHLAGASLVELIPQLNLLSPQKFTQCLVSFDNGATWRYPDSNDAIVIVPLSSINDAGVPFEVIHEKLTGVQDSPIIAFALVLPNTAVITAYMFKFSQPMDLAVMQIDSTRQQKV